MQDIVELERRLAAALGRIEQGIDGLSGQSDAHQAEIDMARAEAETRAEAAEERLAAALSRLAEVEASAAEAAEAAAREAHDAALAEFSRAQEVAEAERQASAPAVAESATLGVDISEGATIYRLRERLNQAREREMQLHGEYEGRLVELTGQLDVQSLELARMRKTAISLREELTLLREASSAHLADPSAINRALLAELDAMRAIRRTEMAELGELVDALDQHLTEAENA